MKKLEKKEIVKSFRGSNGGYALKKSLGELTLLDVYLAVEPDFYMIECMNPEKACVHNQSDSSCKVHRELYRIQKQLARELSVPFYKGNHGDGNRPVKVNKRYRKNQENPMFFCKNIGFSLLL